MPTKKTSISAETKTKKVKASVVAAPKKADPAPKKSNSLRDLRADHFSLKMKHAMGELKEIHKLRKARREIARHLTSLHQS